jgi:hypothetical protein
MRSALCTTVNDTALSCVTSGRAFRTCLAFLAAMVFTLNAVGCGSDYYIGRIESQPDRSNSWHVYKLREYPRDERVTRFLIELLNRDEPGTRYYAAEALDAHLMWCSTETRVCALMRLTSILDDARFALVSWPIHGPLSPGGSKFTESSVRIRALTTLANATRRDFGFDENAWRKYIETLTYKDESSAHPGALIERGMASAPQKVLGIAPRGQYRPRGIRGGEDG